jgi:hypothetical protein
MTKTKRLDPDDHSKHANAEKVAVKADSPAVSVDSDSEPGQPYHKNPHDEFDMAVRELAYFKWEAAGFPEGDGFDFWLEAERELRANQSPSTPE